MANAILRLRVDPATGRRELVIDYTSDSDALPMEHEEQHRALANQVVEGGLRNAKLDVSRAAPDAGDSEPDRSAAEPAAAPNAAKH